MKKMTLWIGGYMHPVLPSSYAQWDVLVGHTDGMVDLEAA
jgi:hypothetical protein